MKAKELLRRYAAGERNFQRANLCGQDLKGKDLSGSDFSYANIRGANFSHTILKDTDLTGVKAGLRGGWFIATGLLQYSGQFLRQKLKPAFYRCR